MGRSGRIEIEADAAALEILGPEHRRFLAVEAEGQHGEFAGKARHVDDVERLVTRYRAHALYEEKEFLPLSQTILGRNANHMAALGLSLHMRHTPFTVSGRI